MFILIFYLFEKKNKKLKFLFLVMFYFQVAFDFQILVYQEVMRPQGTVPVLQHIKKIKKIKKKHTHIHICMHMYMCGRVPVLQHIIEKIKQN